MINAPSPSMGGKVYFLLIPLVSESSPGLNGQWQSMPSCVPVRACVDWTHFSELYYKLFFFPPLLEQDPGMGSEDNYSIRNWAFRVFLCYHVISIDPRIWIHLVLYGFSWYIEIKIIVINIPKSVQITVSWNEIRYLDTIRWRKNS